MLSDGTIIAANPCDFKGQTYAEVLCHELGHLNGWNPNHRGRKE